MSVNHSQTALSHDASTVLGSPALLSGSDDTLDFKLLSRVAVNPHHDVPNLQECVLQQLIDEKPSILPVGDFCPGVAHLFSLGREIPVNLGSSTGYIDNLLVTDDGRLVLVETKLWRNPEALREVVAQTLQYGMAISQLSPSQFEDQLRRADPKGQRLGEDQNVPRYVQKLTEAGSEIELDDDFEDRFDELRRAGEILLLVVGDGIRPGVERLIQWINANFGHSPCKFGLIELRFYHCGNGQRVIVPKTLLRTREVSRHVVSIHLRGPAKDQVTVSVNGTAKTQPVEPPPPPVPGPLTETRLTELIQAKNPPEIVELTNQLRAYLQSSRLVARSSPGEIIYGIEIDGDFVSLVHLIPKQIYFLIPMRAVRALGEERFIECKRKINQIAEFYHSAFVKDPNKNNIFNPSYSVLRGKVPEFVKAVEEIAEMIQNAMTIL